MTDEIEIADIDPQPAVGVRLEIPAGDDQVGAVIRRGYQHVAERLAAELGEAVEELPHSFGSFRFDDEGNLVVVLGYTIPVDWDLDEPGGGLEILVFPAGRTATFVHDSSAGDLMDAYGALEEWLGEREVHPESPPWHVSTTDGEDERVRLFCPIPAGAAV